MKALGSTLGRFVLVFCCDDAFDFQAMGRIFTGLCQVGAWGTPSHPVIIFASIIDPSLTGCFDEFNRLEERILSAVSQQIQNIQLGLAQLDTDPSTQVDLLGRSVKLHSDTGKRFFASWVSVSNAYVKEL